MLARLTTSLAAVALLASAVPTILAVGPFKCTSSSASGFAPVCCTDIEGQIGINCVTAHQIGATDPFWECNQFVYNITGCCQTIGWKNPYNNITVDVCAQGIDPI